MPKAELVLQSACRVFNDRDLEAAGELSSTYRVIKSHDADYVSAEARGLDHRLTEIVTVLDRRVTETHTDPHAEVLFRAAVCAPQRPAAFQPRTSTPVTRLRTPPSADRRDSSPPGRRCAQAPRAAAQNALRASPPPPRGEPGQPSPSNPPDRSSALTPSPWLWGSSVHHPPIGGLAQRRSTVLFSTDSQAPHTTLTDTPARRALRAPHHLRASLALRTTSECAD
jgi:hypothetical protein